MAWALSACVAPLRNLPGEAAPTQAQPEAATGLSAKPGWTFKHHAVAAANPLAAEAGARMLAAGGSAVDAAVAVQMVLTLVEPQSSGIGGGGFLLLWDGERVSAWDGRETAPAEADERLFLKPDGQPMGLQQALVGGRAVGVPGVLRLLQAVHQRHGRLPWAQLMQPAITLAEQGFAVSPRLHALIASRAAALRRDAQAAAYFLGPQGQAWPVGHRLRNPALAQVLRAMATQGADALYQGPIAADIVARVRGHAGNPGRLSLADLAAYRAIEREPLCTAWHQVRVCGHPPPSSGHIAVMQTLGLLDRLPPAVTPQGPALTDGVPGAEWLHVYAEAAKLAQADRERWVADPAFAAPPAGGWLGLLGDAYLLKRASSIGPRATPSVAAGEPEHGTSHISIVDARGQALAFTTSIEYAFGAHLMSDGGTGLSGGFLLNNQLTDFTFAPADTQGRPSANRVQPGKRPRSSMSPTLVFDASGRQLQATLGSPGGVAIPHYTVKTLLGLQAWGLDAQQAVALPNVAQFSGSPLLLEAGRFPASTVQALQARGHKVLETDLTSGLQALQRVPGGWFGGADPRREGVVAGE
ncbi:gamma-glutamyltransferase family protein [Ideonella sp. DXS22W]|uniref:Gamma-glutamyltransferase family protein n=1 Tax=Pseudaquabacterium inlustre TaxID=2984192 RepID=A0ABU9CIG2_9BURK